MAARVELVAGREGMERRPAVGSEAVVATVEPADTRAEAQHTREDEGVTQGRQRR